MSYFELFFSVSTLACSFAALIVAYTSLRISKQVAELNSVNFAPRFIVDFQQNGVELINCDNNLYSIRKVTVYVIRHIGFWISDNYREVDVPLVLHSRCFGILHKQGIISEKEIELSAKQLKLYYSDGWLDGRLREISIELIEDIDYIMQSDYGLESPAPKGYCAPSLNFNESYISIEYQSKNGIIKTYNQFYRALGHGVDDIRQEITLTDFNRVIDKYKDNPTFDNATETIDYYSANKST